MTITQESLLELLVAGEAFATSRRQLIEGIELEYSLVQETRITPAEALASIRAIVQATTPISDHFVKLAQARTHYNLTARDNARRRKWRAAQRANAKLDAETGTKPELQVHVPKEKFQPKVQPLDTLNENDL